MVLVLVLALLASRDDATTVTASDEPTTTSESTTTTTASTTTTTEAPTTTVAPSTTTVPPTTAPPTTAPPPTAPPTTVPAAPTEFQPTVRGVDQGPDHYGIFYGTTYGGGGGFHVIARCRPGTVTVTVLEDGWASAPTDNPAYPSNLWVWADDNELFHADMTDGTVVSGTVTSQVAIRTSGPSEQDMRIKYDCRN